MAGKWHHRAAHTRRGKSGQIIHVRETWVYTLGSDQRDQHKSSFRHSCPICGAIILTVPMRNGGWAHFEGGKGLGRIKHPCFDIGKGLSKHRDDNTPDLFEQASEVDNDG